MNQERLRYRVETDESRWQSEFLRVPFGLRYSPSYRPANGHMQTGDT